MVKNPPTNAEDMGSIPGSKKSPGGGNGNLLQYSCQENAMNRGVGQVHTWGHKESETTERLSIHAMKEGLDLHSASHLGFWQLPVLAPLLHLSLDIVIAIDLSSKLLSLPLSN